MIKTYSVVGGERRRRTGVLLQEYNSFNGTSNAWIWLALFQVASRAADVCIENENFARARRSCRRISLKIATQFPSVRLIFPRNCRHARHSRVFASLLLWSLRRTCFHLLSNLQLRNFSFVLFSLPRPLLPFARSALRGVEYFFATTTVLPLFWCILTTSPLTSSTYHAT